MKIALVAAPYVPIPPPKYGGTEQVIHYLIKGLLEAGHEPILVGTGDSQVDCQLIPYIDKSLSFASSSKQLRSHTQLVKQAERKASKVLRSLVPEVDIIHSHGFDLKNFSHVPNLTTLHGKIDFDNISYYLKRRSLYYASISKNQQLTLPNLKYVGVVYNGEDPDDFPIVTHPEKYVCFLGRFDRDKNPHLAIQLALSLGIKIKLAGKIDYQAEGYFDEEVARYFDNPLVDYLGELGFDDKVKLLSNAVCNLHPTNFREPFGLTVLEAAYCGTPTLATARGSMPELIEPGRTGLLVEDFVEGHTHFEEILAMDRKYIASRARQLFNYRTMTDQYVRAYTTVLESMPRRPKRAGIAPNLLERLWSNLRR